MTRRRLWLDQPLSAYALSNASMHRSRERNKRRRYPVLPDCLEEEAKELYKLYKYLDR
jgi:hypothetical protein